MLTNSKQAKHVKETTGDFSFGTFGGIFRCIVIKGSRHNKAQRILQPRRKPQAHVSMR